MIRNFKDTESDRLQYTALENSLLLVKSNKCNISENFLLPDDKDTYFQNLNKMPDKWIWRDKPITYNTNSFGYRTKEINLIDWENYAIAVGDSQTFGIGLSSELLYHQLVSNSTNVDILNLGLPGAPADLIYYMALNFLEKSLKNPKFVLVIWPEIFRKVWFTDDNSIHIWMAGHHKQIKKYVNFDEVSLNLSLFKKNQLQEFLFRRKSLMMYCKSTNIKFIDCCFDTEANNYPTDIDIITVPDVENMSIEYYNNYCARDYTERGSHHAGPVYHSAAAHYIINRL
jgi:hypothetical protein